MGNLTSNKWSVELAIARDGSYANTLVIARSSSFRLRFSALNRLSLCASFLFLYLSPAFRFNAERTAAGDINSENNINWVHLQRV